MAGSRGLRICAARIRDTPRRPRSSAGVRCTRHGNMRPISGLSVSNSGRDLRPLITFARSLQAASDWSVYHSILLCRPRWSSSTAMKLSGSGSNVPTSSNRKHRAHVFSGPSPMTPDLAQQFAAIALGHVAREYPNRLDHVLAGPEDARGPAELHPVFYGSFDWHSCVHGYWMLAHLYRRFPAIPDAAAIRALFDAAPDPRADRRGMPLSRSPRNTWVRAPLRLGLAAQARRRTGAA